MRRRHTHARCHHVQKRKCKMHIRIFFSLVFAVCHYGVQAYSTERGPPFHPSKDDAVVLITQDESAQAYAFNTQLDAYVRGCVLYLSLSFVPHHHASVHIASSPYSTIFCASTSLSWSLLRSYLLSLGRVFLLLACVHTSVEVPASETV